MGEKAVTILGTQGVKGTVYLYHFILLSLTLILPGCHKVSAEQKQFASFFAHFSFDQCEI